MKKYYSIYAAAAVMLLTACTQDLFQNGDEAVRDCKTISFTAQTVNIQDETRSTAAPDALPLTGDGLELWLMPSETPMVSDATRGTQINSVESLNNFGVSAYRHGAIPSEKTLNEYLTDNNLKPDFFYNLEATKITNTQKFKLTKDFFWPTDDDVLSFFAYAPYGDENVELSAATEDGPQSINFKVNTDVKSQVDLITAQAVSKSHLNTSTTPSVELNFTHQLTGIRFVIGDQFLKGWIKSISLKGVYTEGIYTIGGGWTLDDKKKGNFTISYNLDKPVAGTPGEEVSASDEVFMMIPHTFADDDAATIEVVYNDKYTDYIVSAPLKGQTWKAGKTVTYAITSNKLTTLRIGQIQFATTPEGAPKRIWQAGDKIGMYVVDADGKKLKHKNVPVTFDGANWNIDHTTAEGTIYKLAGESFYFYYPYSNVSNGQPTGYPEQCPELKATAPVFFEGVIDYFDYKKDQSTLANFLATDLQVARAEDDGRASMIKATMERQVGLARFKFATSKTIPQTITYINNGSKQTSGSVTIAPSTNFVTNKPYLGDNATYYFYTKPNTSTTFNSNPSDANHWLEAVNITLAAGEYTTDANIKTVQDYRKNWTYQTAVYLYRYTGGVQTHTVPESGYAVMECWGANGGASPVTDTTNGTRGIGGYTKGTISVSANQKFYVYVGGTGTNKNSAIGTTNAGGWNGGGISSANGQSGTTGGGGGGSTDIRLALAHATTTTVWNNIASLRSRIMVAGGGGGCGNATMTGGCGGGLIGGTGTAYNTSYGSKNSVSLGGTQTESRRNAEPTFDENIWHGKGGFGYASQTANPCGTNITHNVNGVNYWGSGGGGGWYGGQKGGGSGGAGGSSFISGHPGCNAVNTSTGAHLGASTTTTYNNVSYVFTNTLMLDGEGVSWTSANQVREYQNWTYPGVVTPAGTKVSLPAKYDQNGYCRITLTH